VWDKREVRDALAARDISMVYRQLRRVGVSQRHIAALTGQSQSEVSEILKGRQVMAYDVLVRIADGLGVPRGYMGLAYDEATAVRVAGTPDDPLAEEEESVKRRRFLAHAAAVTVGAAVFGPESESTWVSDPTHTPAPARIGETDVRQIEAATKALRGLDYQYGGGFCRDAVVAQLTWARQLLEASTVDRTKKRLYVALADLHNLAGWTSFDIGMIDPARTHFAQALAFAKEGQNNHLVANVLYRMGRVYLHQDAADDALKLFQLGQLAAQEAGSEQTVALLCMNEAWAYALLNMPEQALKQIGRARDEFSRADLNDAPAWSQFFNVTDMSAMIGTVHSTLARMSGVDVQHHTRIAIPALTRAIESYGPEWSRSKAFNLAALATNHLLDGDIDHGAKVGHGAAELADGLNSKRVKDRLKPLFEEAAKRRNNQDARELAQRVKQIAAS
jgi:transcriptional regulator with XRE-family HTH domain/tetratricopeptide (TPR) repeat protein